MSSAFQSNGFQSNAFQIARAAIASSSGGFEYAKLGNKRRTKREIDEARAKFGLEIYNVIEDVAIRQSKDFNLDEQQRFEEFNRELELRNLEFEASYLTELNERRAQLIAREIIKLKKKQLLEEEQILTLLMMSL